MKKIVIVYIITLFAIIGDNIIYSEVNSYIISQNNYTISEWLFVLILILIGFLILYLLRLINAVAECSLIQKMTNKSKIKTMKSYLNKSESNDDILNLMLNDYQAFEEQYINGFFHILRYISEFIFALSILLVINAKMTIASLILGLIPLLLKNFINALGKKFYAKLSNSLDALTRQLQEVMNGHEEIYIYNMETYCNQQFNLNLNALKKKKIAYQSVMAFISAILDNVSHLSYLVTVIIAMYLVANNNLTIALFVLFSSMNESITYPIKFIINTYSKMKSVNSIKKKIDNIQKSEEKIYSPVLFNQTIRLQSIGVNYLEQTILKNINLSIYKGNKILIQGENGSGKSTICKVLSKQISLSSGHIYIDDLPLEDIDNQALYQIMKYISTDEYIMNDSIQNNLLLGLDQNYLPTQLPDFCENLDKNAILLSSGQKQQLTLLRSLIRHPQILILDEALSAVSKDLNQELLEKIFAEDNYTIIQIDHHAKEKNYNLYDHIYEIKDHTLIEKK